MNLLCLDDFVAVFVVSRGGSTGFTISRVDRSHTMLDEEYLGG